MKYVTLLTGPQGSGKTLMAQKLSARFKSYWAVESDLADYRFFQKLSADINLVVFDGINFQIAAIKMLAQACRTPHLKLPNLLITTQLDAKELEGIGNLTIVHCSSTKPIA